MALQLVASTLGVIRIVLDNGMVVLGYGSGLDPVGSGLGMDGAGNKWHCVD
jgi:hypothetical protein